MTHRPRSALALVLLSLAVLAPAESQEDALPIILKAFEAAKVNEIRVRSYVFHERVEERLLNRKGEEKRRQSKTWDVTLFETGDYRRLIAANDRPLDRTAEAREQRKLDRHIRKLQKETPRQRARRVAKVEKERQEGEEFLEEITKAFDFRRIGEEEVDGEPTFVISAEPKPGYRPANRMARVLPRLRAKLWVSSESYNWVQAEMETFDDITWAVVFKLRAGTEIRFKQRPLDDGVWVTESWRVRYRTRVALVYNRSAELVGSYSDFRRFTTDTTVTGWTPAD